jgi:CarboxypepD_reg-like domain
LKPSTAGKAVVTGYGTLRKDSNKAKLSAGSAMAMQAPNNEMTGTVLDQQHQPVPNAAIILKGTRRGATTDENGNFSIPTYDSTAVAVISALGYAPKDQQLRRGANNIILNEESPDLSDEVVVTALGVRRTSIVDTTAKPQGGWKSFREYVYNQLHIQYDSTTLSDDAYSDGDLELEFSIRKSGEPYNFKILNTPDTLTANKAIKAITAGPKWISRSKNSKKRVRVEL